MSAYEIDNSEYTDEVDETSVSSLPSLKDLTKEVNIADLLDEEELNKIGLKIVADYEEDESSRKVWLIKYKEGMEKAIQVRKDKTYPWTKASNVKFPLMTMAALAFHARAYPALIPSDGVVSVKVLGKDPTQEKEQIAERVEEHMNFQVMEQMEGWEEGMDTLLITLPITGMEFKKTYYDYELERNVSEHVFAKDLVVNYYAKDLESAVRKTHIIEMSRNELQEKINAGLFCDQEYGNATARNDETTRLVQDGHGLREPKDDLNVPRTLLECHCWYDLDDDGYAEPYICTVDKDSRKVARIVTRYQEANIIEKDGRLVRIIPDEYFTAYPFIPSPDGGFYALGFIHLVGSINEAVDTLINQLIDAGTLSNLQSGFLSRSFRQRGGNMQFQPGEWKLVNASGQDLKDGVFPLPVREPSGVLFQLLGMLIDAGQRVTSTTDIMVGENPGQNQKATTTAAVVENGQKVFTAVYKRIRRALSNEFKKLFYWNGIYFNMDEYQEILGVSDPGDTLGLANDYKNTSLKIVPSADPNASSSHMKLQKAQMLLQLVPMGLPRGIVLKRYLQALEIDNLDEFNLDQLDEQAPPPDPKIMIQAQDLQLKQMVAQHDAVVQDREQARKEHDTAIKEMKVKLDHHVSVGKANNDTTLARATLMQNDNQQEPSSE